MSQPTAPVRGNSGIVFTLKDGATQAVAYDGNAKNVRVTSADKDDADLTFLEATSGETKDYSIVVTAVQATNVGSLWRLLWENPGKEFAMVYGPHGNAVPTADKPHFLGTVKANGRPEVGVQAGRSKTRGDFEYTFEVVGNLALDTGAGA